MAPALLEALDHHDLARDAPRDLTILDTLDGNENLFPFTGIVVQARRDEKRVPGWQAGEIALLASG
jgi:hypothetical protein